MDIFVRLVDILRIKSFVTKERFEHWKDLYPNGLVPTCSVTPGVNNVNANKWSEIQPTDVTFFSTNRVLYSYGFVTYKVQNKQLAEYIWGWNTN